MKHSYEQYSFTFVVWNSSLILLLSLPLLLLLLLLPLLLNNNGNFNRILDLVTTVIHEDT